MCCNLFEEMSFKRQHYFNLGNLALKGLLNISLVGSELHVVYYCEYCNLFGYSTRYLFLAFL